MFKKSLKAAALVLPLLLPVTAMAHVSPIPHYHMNGFSEGFFHPLTGIDHMLAMLLVGVWSAMNTRRWWLAPITFAVLLLVGALIGAQGIAFGATEYVIMASLLIIGLMVALQWRSQPMLGAVIVGVIALFHGFAHGGELSNSPSALAGMVCATALLHIVGLGIGFMLTKFNSSAWAPRVIGMVSVAAGVGLLTGVIEA